MIAELVKKEKPILFSGAMVRSILAGTKTQTRRVVKLPVIDRNGSGCEIAGCELNSMLRQEQEIGAGSFLCPYGGVGDVLWVRETWRVFGGPEYEYQHCKNAVQYRADETDFEQKQWQPSIFMPRWASRIDIEITGVRVERLNAISEQDAVAEGAAIDKGNSFHVAGYEGRWAHATAKGCFETLWESINGKKHSWASNPWVWGDRI